MAEEVYQNRDPAIISSMFTIASNFFSAYGWYILFLGILFALCLGPIETKYLLWRRRKVEQKRMAEYMKHPERIISMQETMMRHRERLQEQNDRINQEHSEKLKKAEEAKRQEKIDKYKCFQSGTSFKEKQESETEQQNPKKPNKKNDNKLRGNDYNPLMGSRSSGTTYRPSRRGGSTGG